MTIKTPRHTEEIQPTVFWNARRVRAYMHHESGLRLPGRLGQFSEDGDSYRVLGRAVLAPDIYRRDELLARALLEP